LTLYTFVDWKNKQENYRKNSIEIHVRETKENMRASR